MEISRLLHRSMARLHAPQAVPEFQPHYQPKIDPTTGALAGVEALLRWRPDGHAPISPDQFIPIAEATGVIVPLGIWCFLIATIDRV
jgi:EAL domain-containing protein (putative c-di-GMP-specific phosphodiesterase class I)